MAIAIEEDKRAKRATGPAGFAPGGASRPAVETQPAPQFIRTNAGPMLQPPAAPPVVPAAPDPTQQQLANQTAMYVQGAQAAAAARPAPAPVAPAAAPAPVIAPAIAPPVVPPAAPRPAGMNPAVGMNTMNQRAYAETEARKTAANPTGSIYGNMAEPAAAPAVDPMAGQAAFVPPRMGRRDPAPMAAPVASAAPTQGAWEPSQAMRDALPAAAQAADEARANVTSAFRDGNIASGIGQLVRGAVVAPTMAAVESGANLLSAAGDVAGAVVRPVVQAGYSAITGSNEQLFDGKPAAPAPARTTAPQATAAAAAVAPTKTAPQVAGMGDARRAAGDYDKARVAAPPAQPAAPTAAQPDNNGFTQVAPGILRKGNTFTDQAGTQDAAFLNRGAISPQNMQAADNLAANYNTNQQALARLQSNNATSQAQGFQPQQARQFDRAASIRALNDLRSPEAIALRNLRIDAQEEARDGARMGRAGRGMGQAGQAYAALLGELTTGTRQGQIAEMQDGTTRYTTDVREAGANQRAVLGETGATARAGMAEGGNMARARMTNDLQQGELGLKREAQGFTTRAAARLDKAQADYMAADTPEKKAAAAKVIRELQGKDDGTPRGKDRFVPIGGGQEYDPRAMAVVTRPQRVFDTVTGQEIGAPSQAAPLPPKDKLVKDVVYDTPKGRAIWDGKNFIPVQQ